MEDFVRIHENPLSIRPVDLPNIVSERWVVHSLKTVAELRKIRDFKSLDYLKDVLREFIDIQETPKEHLIEWNWKPLLPDSKWWPQKEAS